MSTLSIKLLTTLEGWKAELMVMKMNWWCRFSGWGRGRRRGEEPGDSCRLCWQQGKTQTVLPSRESVQSLFLRTSAKQLDDLLTVAHQNENLSTKNKIHTERNTIRMNVQGKICEHTQKRQRLSSVLDCFSFSVSVELCVRRITEILGKIIDKGDNGPTTKFCRIFFTNKVQLWICYRRQLRSGLKFDVWRLQFTFIVSSVYTL